jgi:hypothetical protein
VRRFRLQFPGRGRRPADNGKPILAVDIDGVISLFGFDEPPSRFGIEFHLVDGSMQCLSTQAGRLLRQLADQYELVWVTGWERGAQRMSRLLRLPKWPYLTFDGAARFGSADWKLAPLERYARGRALAWIDDSFDERCYEWARDRDEPTLLVATEPEIGLTEKEAEALSDWANSFEPREREQPSEPG